MDEFYQKISDWLGAFGYVKIYQINGANKNYQEFHFIKDQIRVVCKKEFSEEYCYLSTDILKVKEPMSLRTGKYAIGTTQLNRLHEVMKASKENFEFLNH